MIYSLFKNNCIHKAREGLNETKDDIFKNETYDYKSQRFKTKC